MMSNVNARRHVRYSQILACKEKLSEAVVEFVREIHWAIFPDLCHFLSPYMEVQGDLRWEIPPNVVLWDCGSATFLHLLQDLVTQERLYLHPVLALAYLIEGHLLDLSRLGFTFPVVWSYLV